MEENDIKKLRKIPGFGDLKSFRFLVEKMYTELEAQPEKEKRWWLSFWESHCMSWM